MKMLSLEGAYCTTCLNCPCLGPTPASPTHQSHSPIGHFDILHLRLISHKSFAQNASPLPTPPNPSSTSLASVSHPVKLSWDGSVISHLMGLYRAEPGLSHLCSENTGSAWDKGCIIVMSHNDDDDDDDDGAAQKSLPLLKPGIHRATQKEIPGCGSWLWTKPTHSHGCGYGKEERRCHFVHTINGWLPLDHRIVGDFYNRVYSFGQLQTF